MSLIAELKRRNVFRVGAAYLALCWIVAQVTELASAALNLPPSILAIVFWVSAIGFPFVVVFAWAFEMTPEGLKRERDVDRSDSITQHTARRLDYLTIGFVAVAIALFAFDRLSPARTSQAQTATEAAANGLDREAHAVDERTHATGAAPGGPPAAAAALAPDDKSIAVLPFVNMSEDKANEYFSDGISEELLNLLVKIPELKVSSRSSAFSFKGKDIDLPVVAAKLNVAHILEGSVRKSGNRVRITAQLIHAQSDKHLWSETYDRELTDIFAVQDEIAAAVVEQLKVKLLGAAPKARAVNPDAYALFLQARQLRRQNTAASLREAETLIEQALALDSKYTEALDEQSRIYVNEASGNVRGTEEAYRLAREAVNKALQLDPDFARAHDSLGWIAGTYDLDLAAAARHYTRALELEPANLSILGNASAVLWGLGRLDETIAVLEYTVARDPINTIGIANLASAYISAGRLDEASARMRTLLNLAPDYIGAHVGLATALLLQGDASAALAEAQQEVDAIQRLGAVAMAAHASGQTATADSALAELQREHAVQASYLIACVLSRRGDADGAFAWLDKAVAAHDSAVSSANTDPLLATLHADPRWLPFLQKLGMAPEQLAAIPFEVKLPQ